MFKPYNVAKLKDDWELNKRWQGITRPYSAEDVVRLRGSVQIEYTLARMGAERLWRLMQQENYVPALGAITGNQAVNNGVGLQADAIIANEGTMSIVRSKVTSNQSSGDTVYGGALYTYRTASRTTIVESTFADNVAYDIVKGSTAVLRTSGNNTLTGTGTTVSGAYTPNPLF